MMVRGDQGLEGGEGRAWQRRRGEAFRLGQEWWWDSSEMEVTEQRVLESRQSTFTSQLPLVELGNHGPAHDLPAPPFLYL